MKNINLSILGKLTILNKYISEEFEHSEDPIEDYKKIKTKISGGGICEKLKINGAMLQEFETAVNNFSKHKENNELSYISALRVASWLETLSSITGIDLSINLTEITSNEQLAIKQIRALELLLRDIIQSHNGGKDSLALKLNEFLKEEVVQKWIASGDETGVLSGTTFSELSALFLDKRIFASYDELFPQERGLRYDKKKQTSLRYFLDDIRIIRNSVAHNKRVSNVKLELLNAYYNEIAGKVEKAKGEGKTTVNPGVYLDVSEEELKAYIGGVKEDVNEIKEGVENLSKKMNQIIEDTSEIKETTTSIKSDTTSSKSMLKYVIGGVALILLVVGALFFINKDTNTKTNQIASNTEIIKDDIKDVKNIVTGDAELKNMSNTGDLTVAKELNQRTKDVNAKRIAIIYFDNTSGEANLDKLKKGLTGMLISDLSNINMLDIVERDRLEDILKEQKLNNNKQFDNNTASKVGKLLGAEMILTGAYFEMFGSFRIDARFIDVETGKILKSEGVDGQSSNFFKLEKQLAWKIINNLDVSLSDEESTNLKNIEKNEEISYQDAILFADALDAIDNGDSKNAINKLNKVLKNNPNFQPAKDELNKLQKTA